MTGVTLSPCDPNRVFDMLKLRSVPSVFAGWNDSTWLASYSRIFGTQI